MAGSRLLVRINSVSAQAEQEPFSLELRQGKPKLTVVHHPLYNRLLTLSMLGLVTTLDTALSR